MEEKESIISKLKTRFSRQEGLQDLLSMSEHWNGYKRENAVRRLGMLGNPLAIQKLLVRVNDWVPEVRIAAKASILKLAAADNTEAFIQFLPDLYHLRICSRDDHEVFIKAIETFLLTSKNSKTLILGLENEDPFVVRHCMSLIIKNQLLDPETIVQQCLNHSDLIVRGKASNLLRVLNGEMLESALKIALNDRFMPIRREAFQISIRRGTHDEELLEQFLFDRHPSIREIAIEYLVKQGVDIKTIYSNSLASKLPRVLRCAIWGLAELNNAESISDVRTFLSDSQPSVRKQSINSLAKLMGEKASDILIGGLGDESSAVCKVAARLLSKNGVTFTAEQLLEIVERSGYKHTLDSCVGISRRINKWERLLFIVCLFDEKYKTIFCDTGQLGNAIRQWDNEFNRSAIQPTNDQLNLLADKFRDNKMAQDNQSIVFTLKTYGLG